MPHGHGSAAYIDAGDCPSCASVPNTGIPMPITRRRGPRSRRPRAPWVWINERDANGMPIRSWPYWCLNRSDHRRTVRQCLAAAWTGFRLLRAGVPGVMACSGTAWGSVSPFSVGQTLGRQITPHLIGVPGWPGPDRRARGGLRRRRRCQVGRVAGSPSVRDGAVNTAAGTDPRVPCGARGSSCRSPMSPCMCPGGPTRVTTGDRPRGGC